MPRKDITVLVLALMLLAGATLPWIGQLGLEYDEAHFLPLAVKVAFGAEERLDLPWGITIADRPIPFVTMPYVGTLDSFIYAVPYRVFGTHPVVSRVTNLLLGFLLFTLAWLVVRKEAGQRAAALLLGLLLVDVELVLHIPTNFGPILLQQILAVAAILALQRWWINGRKMLFFVAVAALALAFHEKLTFIWVLSPLALGVLLFKWKETWQKGRWWMYPAGLLLAVLIVSPILYFAFAVPEVIFAFGKASTKAPPNWGQLIEYRWHVFDLMMRGGWTTEFSVGSVPGEPHRGPALLLLFFAGLAGSIFTRQRLALTLYVTAAGVWFWNLAFPDAGRMHHLLLMAPFWQMGCAIAFHRFPKLPQGLLLLLLLWSGWDATRSYLWFSQQAHRTGGVNHWSDMTTRAVEWLDQNRELEPVTTSWGITRPLLAMSEGRLKTVEHVFDTLTEPLSAETTNALTQLIHKERQVWLISSVLPHNEVQWQRVVTLAARYGKSPIHVKDFHSRDGRSHISAYMFTPFNSRPRSWTLTQGQEFSSPDNQFRIELEGKARGQDEELTVQWLNDSGTACITDHRSFYWTPHIHDRSTLEFSRNYWPNGFVRQQFPECSPRSIRVGSSLKQARITKIEVPTP